ncbi:glycosyl hydrolase family 3 N terminal domain-containing protein [Amylocarpus encephaloides]|uniref:Probable beta-glucosidase G n=1 Tax=Amylocarpus encephaloides TaxID=45428 RepID=A0A9P7YS15_9HELO|nr:glycosyl hydrolase family 3 N terminal domain-containing protein [Amylocarpus encephaloides]
MLSSFLSVAAFAASASAIVQPANYTILGQYGNSPPVYPSPHTNGIGWEAALDKAKAFVAQLTPQEKDDMVTGTPGPCVGNIVPIPRLGFNGLCLQDGPLAIRVADYASVFPAGVSTAATFDRKLMYRRGVDMGAEFRGKGSQIALTPVAGPLGRSAYAGRNWEGFSPDPYLTGVAMEESIMGIQSNGVQATAKHWVGNEQETQRNPTYNSTTDQIIQESLSANIDDRTMHELYMWPFANAVKAGVASFMCSYQRLNGSYACENSKANNGLLKGELGFQGYVMSDWGGTHSGVSSIEGGLDMDMPGGLGIYGLEFGNNSYFGGNVSTAVANGTIPVSRVDDMVIRIMTPYYFLGQDNDFPLVDPSSGDLNTFSPRNTWFRDFNLNGTRSRDVRDNHAALIREMGAAATVLLKNVNNTLPLNAPKSIGIFGNDAADIPTGPYNQQNYEYGTLVAGGGSGTGRLTYIVTPLDAMKAQAAKDGAIIQYYLNNTLIADTNWATTNGGLTIPTTPEVCLVFLKTWAEEAADRTTLDSDWMGNEVVDSVAAWCPNTVVVMHSSGINNLPWASHPNVTAILSAHFPGQESGNSLVDVLYGAVNPSAKLPYTIALDKDDYNGLPITAVNSNDPNAWQAYFTEKLEIDYRYFDAQNMSVLYEFGYGLSYTTFSLADISISKADPTSSIAAMPTAADTVPGGKAELWDIIYNVTATLTNTGSVAGAQVPQLYVSFPDTAPAGTPPKQLRGFEKVYLEPGESQTVSFGVMRRDLSYWDIVSQEWVIPTGFFGFSVGFSSRDMKVNGEAAVVG